MGTRLIALVLALLLAAPVAGCIASPGGPASATAAPTMVPSPGCGGFRLRIRNTGSAAVLVYINGTEMLPVNAGDIRDFAEWGSPAAGPLPWKVEIADAATGANVATREITAPSDGDGGATLEVRPGAGGEPTVGDVQSAAGC